MTSTRNFWEIITEFFNQIFGYPDEDWETDEIPRIDKQKNSMELDNNVKLKSSTKDENDSELNAPVSMRIRRSVSFESAVLSQR